MSQIIVVDSREQAPFDLRGYKVRRKALKVGDYSVLGAESVVAVERKSPQDLINTVMTNRARFVLELERAAAFEAFAIVVESSMIGLSFHLKHTRATLKTVLARVAVLSSRHRVPFLFCDNRPMAEMAALEVLRPYF